MPQMTTALHMSDAGVIDDNHFGGVKHPVTWRENGYE
jgi:hypothetical protein